MLTPELLVAGAALAVGALVQGSIGFGMALIAAPVLVSLEPSWVPGPLMLAGLPMLLLMGWRERHAVSLRGMGPPVAAQMFGIGVGLVVRQQVSGPVLGVLVGGVVLVAVALSMGGLHVRASARNLVLAALAAGFMGATAAIPGPPLALVHQHVSPARLRGTLVPFFLVGNLVTLAGLHVSGTMGPAETRAGLLLIPGILLGLFLSNFAAQYLSHERTRVGVLLLSAVAAISLIVRSA